MSHTLAYSIKIQKYTDDEKVNCNDDGHKQDEQD